MRPPLTRFDPWERRAVSEVPSVARRGSRDGARQPHCSRGWARPAASVILKAELDGRALRSTLGSLGVARRSSTSDRQPSLPVGRLASRPRIERTADDGGGRWQEAAETPCSGPRVLGRVLSPDRRGGVCAPSRGAGPCCRRTTARPGATCTPRRRTDTRWSAPDDKAGRVTLIAPPRRTRCPTASASENVAT